MTFLRSFLIALTFILAHGAAFAQVQHDSLAKLHLVYLVGKDAANMGKAKACNPKVKAFAAQMSNDYVNGDQKLQIYAEQNNYTLNTPEFSDWETKNIEKIQADVNRISDVEGCSFDNLYLQVVRDGHGFAIKVADKILANEGNAKNKSFMNSALNALKINQSRAINLLGR